MQVFYEHPLKFLFNARLFSLKRVSLKLFCVLTHSNEYFDVHFGLLIVFFLRIIVLKFDLSLVFKNVEIVLSQFLFSLYRCR